MEAEPSKGVIAEALTEHMASTGLSARALAAALGLSHPTVLALTRGTSDVQLATLWALAEYFQWGPAETGQAAWSRPPGWIKKRKRNGRRVPLRSG